MQTFVCFEEENRKDFSDIHAILLNVCFEEENSKVFEQVEAHKEGHLNAHIKKNMKKM